MCNSLCIKYYTSIKLLKLRGHNVNSLETNDFNKLKGRIPLMSPERKVFEDKKYFMGN